MPLPALDLAKVIAGCVAMAGAVQLVPDMSIPLIELMVKAFAGALVYALCVVSLDAAGARRMAQTIFTKVKSRLNRDRPIAEN